MKLLIAFDLHFWVNESIGIYIYHFMRKQVLNLFSAECQLSLSMTKAISKYLNNKMFRNLKENFT